MATYLFDFFLWGYAKPKVSQADPETTEQMKEIVKKAVRSVPQDMLQSVMGNSRIRLQLCIVAQGGLFEV